MYCLFIAIKVRDRDFLSRFLPKNKKLNGGKEMKIIIAGAGAMGSRFGLMLHQAGNDVIFVDGWPEHIEAIRKNGLVADFNGEVVTAKIPIYPQTEVASIDFTADLVILFTKAMQLAAMWTAGLEGPGKVKLFGNGSIDLQNLGAQSEQAVEAVIKVLNNAGWFCCKVLNLLSNKVE